MYFWSMSWESLLAQWQPQRLGTAIATDFYEYGRAEAGFRVSAHQARDFKINLRSYLFGTGGEIGPLRDPEQCGLGSWIINRLRGQGTYAHLPEAQQFDQKHDLIHREANRLMKLYDVGQSEQVGANFSHLQQLASEMIVQLQTMEAKLRTEV